MYTINYTFVENIIEKQILFVQVQTEKGATSSVSVGRQLAASNEVRASSKMSIHRSDEDDDEDENADDDAENAATSDGDGAFMPSASPQEEFKFVGGGGSPLSFGISSIFRGD